ncbi:MAG: four-helix bundle copper-binding protein [Bacteroides sp.]|nr:four-helix bundle copper-binding protein [Bacteroides sp.]
MLPQEKVEKKKEVAHKLAECVIYCNHCFSSCLEEEDVKMMKKCIRLDKDCAEVCQFTLGMLHRSPFVDGYLEMCIKVCEACAEECSKHQNEHCQECAKMCKECAEVCRNFREMFQK